MMSDNMSLMFPHFNLDFAGIHLNSYQLCAIISTIIILPTACLPNLRLLSYISGVGLCSFTIYLLLVSFLFSFSFFKKQYLHQCLQFFVLDFQLEE